MDGAVDQRVRILMRVVTVCSALPPSCATLFGQDLAVILQAVIDGGPDVVLFGNDPRPMLSEFGMEKLRRPSGEDHTGRGRTGDRHTCALFICSPSQCSF